jgi:erythritol transport system substrate-binding protein
VRCGLKCRLSSALTLLMVAVSGCHARDTRKLVAIIVPSQDNPYFKAEADAAAKRATELGYRVRVDTMTMLTGRTI